MIKFEKRFLYTFADVEEAKKLIGKKGIFSDESIDHEDLRVDDLFVLEGAEEGDYPFKTGDRYFFRYFYYDPNLGCKRAYYLDGKKIQFKGEKHWFDCDGEPIWDDDTEFRIKPETETRLTNREVAEWIARGEGQVLHLGNVMTDFYYGDTRDDEPCAYKIRKWSDDGWHEATKEYIEGLI